MNVPVLLAFDIGEVLWVLFVIVAMISGIINKMKEGKAAEARQQRRAQGGPPRAREQLQDEISQFLEELNTGNPVPSPRPQQQRPTRERARSSQQPQRGRKRRQSGQESATANASDQGRTPSTRRNGLEHEISTMKQRHVQSEVHERHLQSNVGEHQPGRLAESMAEAGASQAAVIAAVGLPPVAQLLTRRDGLANAIVLNEILSPPVSRRRVRGH
ncbi:hypothetical protein GC176_09240 [bacterium]|nr:hypothetical protein [bacterium]